MKTFRLLYPFFFRNAPKKLCSSFLYSSLANDPTRDLSDYLVTVWAFSSGEVAKLFQSAKFRRDCVENVERVVGFLNENGFSDTQIRKVISTDYRLLKLQVERTLMPKMKAFQDWGLSAHEIAQMVERNPYVLHASLEKTLRPMVGVLKTVLPGDKNLGNGIKSLFAGLGTTLRKGETLEAHVSKLRSLGVPESSIWRMFVSSPRMFHHNPSSLERAMEKAHEFGFDYSSSMFPGALATLSGFTESMWNSKVELLKRFGWTDENVMEAFRKAPFFMGLSTSSLERKLDYFTNELNLTAPILTATPNLLTFSLEKRIIPRIAVIRKLESSDIVKRREWSFITVLTWPEKRFCEKCVFKNMNKCPEVVQVYRNSKEKKNSE